MIGARQNLNLKKEDGAVTILFTIIVLMGIMSGLLALVVDGGQLMLERRVVQNVADASSLYLGQNCALGQYCATNNPITYAQNNSPDLASSITSKCGSAPLPGCGPLSGNSKDCQTSPAATTQFVRVRAETQTINGGTALAPAFAGLFGDGNVSDGSWTVQACSQVMWGTSSQVNVTLPLAISVCNYATPTGTAGGTNKNIPQFSPANTPCTGISSLDSQLLTGTDAGLAVVAIPNMDSTCTTGTRVNVGDVVTYVLPSAMSTVCANLLNRLKSAIGQQSYIPVFSTSYVAGGVRKMQVVSFVRFRLISLKYGGVITGTPGPTNTTACTNLCIVGQFTKGVTPIGKVSTSSSVPALGAMAVELIP